MPPPAGTHTIIDFKIISHVTLKIPKKAAAPTSKTKLGAGEEPDSDYE